MAIQSPNHRIVDTNNGGGLGVVAHFCKESTHANTYLEADPREELVPQPPVDGEAAEEEDAVGVPPKDVLPGRVQLHLAFDLWGVDGVDGLMEGLDQLDGLHKHIAVSNRSAPYSPLFIHPP